MERIGILVVFAAACVFAVSVIKRNMPQYTLLASLCAGTAIFMFVLGDAVTVIESFKSLCSKTGIDASLLVPVVKICGVTFLGQLGIQLCRDAGENIIGDKLETVVKICVIVLCLPSINTLFELVMRIE